MRLFLLLSVSLCALSSLSAADQPNIVYILLDDAGYGDLSCYGQQKFSTPHMDKLAAEGMKFTRHYSGSTVCAPTRCALMTGLHTGHCYVRGNREVQPEGQAPMPADTVSIPRLLRQAGYTTGAFGKWGLGFPGSASDPMEHFDRFYGYNCQRLAHSYYPEYLWNDREKVEFDGTTYAPDVISEQTLDWIREVKDQPFFAYLAITIPHAAMQVPDEYAAPFRKQFSEFDEKVGKYAGTVVNNPIAGFAGMMDYVDKDVAKVMALLKELEIDENTLVILTSDNGPHQEGGHNPKFFDSNGPFTGHKRDLTEGGIRTFMIARWPGKVEAGTTSDHVSAHWDMLPTFCELAGVDRPENTDGLSMVSTLTGEGKQVEHDYLYWEFHDRGGKKAAVWGDWKALQLNVGKDQSSPIAIYNLSKDVAEQVNLASANPELVRKAKSIFEAAHTPDENWTWQKKKKQR